MTFVIDASLTMNWYFGDESSPVTDALLDLASDTGAIVPSQWRLDVANALQMAVRRQRIDTIYRDASLKELALLPIIIDADTSSYAWSTTLRLAKRFSLTMFDAAYLELAQRRSLPLATLDQELRCGGTGARHRAARRRSTEGVAEVIHSMGAPQPVTCSLSPLTSSLTPSAFGL